MSEQLGYREGIRSHINKLWLFGIRGSAAKVAARETIQAKVTINTAQHKPLSSR